MDNPDRPTSTLSRRRALGLLGTGTAAAAWVTPSILSVEAAAAATGCQVATNGIVAVGDSLGSAGNFLTTALKTNLAAWTIYNTNIPQSNKDLTRINYRPIGAGDTTPWYLSVGSAGDITSSGAGCAWTGGSFGNFLQAYDDAWASGVGRWVVVGQNGTNAEAAYSSNGRGFQRSPVTYSSTPANSDFTLATFTNRPNELRGVAYNALLTPTFVAVGLAGNATNWATSTNGQSWTGGTAVTVGSGGNPPKVSFLDVAVSSSCFVAVGSYKSGPTDIPRYFKYDGTTWTDITPTLTNNVVPRAVNWSSTLGRFIVVGDNGTVSIATTANPTSASWTTYQVTGFSTLALRDVVWTGTDFVVVGDVSSGNGLIITSPTGATAGSWTSRTSNIAARLTGVAAS